MGRRPAALLASVAALAAAFVAGWLAGRAPRTGPAAVPGLDDATTAAIVPRPVAPALSAASRDAPPATSAARETSVAAAGPGPSPGSAPPAAAAPATVVLPVSYASILVRVLGADGMPARGAHVGLRPAGSDVPEDEARPREPVDAEGRARFLTVDAGPFDVDAWRDSLEVARATGVRGTRDVPTEVTLRLPRLVDAVFRAEGLPVGTTWQLVVRGPPRADAGGGAWPRDQHTLQSAATVLRTRVPEGVPLTVSGWAGIAPAGAACAPFEVVAPAEVAVPFRSREPVAREALTTLTLRLVPEATEGTLPPRGYAAVDTLLTVDGSLRKQQTWTIGWRPDDPDGANDTTVGVLAGSKGSFHWQARGGPADAVTLPELPPGGAVTVGGRLRIPPASVVVGFDDVVVEDERGAVLVPSEALGVHVFTGDESVGSAHDPVQLRGLLGDLRTAALTIATDAWHVSRTVAAAPIGATRVRVELGGYLVVHVPRPPPTNAGPLRLTRTDGGWLGERASPLAPTGAPEESPAEQVRNGTVLGPLPAGAVEFEVSLGGVRLGAVTANVVAGEVSVLTLR